MWHLKLKYMSVIRTDIILSKGMSFCSLNLFKMVLSARPTADNIDTPVHFLFIHVFTEDTYSYAT